MQPDELTKLAQQLVDGDVDIESFVRRMKGDATADLGDARIDLDRARRCGYPEVIFGQGKSVDVLLLIVERLLAEGQPALVTRVDAEQAAALVAQFAGGVHNERARTFRVQIAAESTGSASARGHVAVLTAGTSDLPVADEARETLIWMGVETTLVEDVGVAGPQRLAEQLHRLSDIGAAVVVAGMEGALPSVVGGHVPCPVIAVPTSIGYGASFGGVAALLGMLNSCAANVTVVNIDAGFKGGYVAGMIARQRVKTEDRRPKAEDPNE
jgi:NCAIR mutase (PurE)-related protein